MKKQLLFKTDIDAIVNNRCKYMILDKNINDFNFSFNNYSILELKYNQEYNDFASNLASFLPIKLTKYSKSRCGSSKYLKIPRSPKISDFADFGPRYLRAQKELDGKSGIYDCVLDPNFHVNKFLERSETFFAPKTKILKKVPNLEISVRSLWGGS